MSSLTLFELTPYAKELMDHIESIIDEKEDIEDNFSSALQVTDEGQLLIDKLIGYTNVIKTMEAIEKAKREEIKRIENSANIVNNAIKRLKTRIYEFMKVTGVENFRAGNIIFRIQVNGGLQSMVVDNPESLPDDCTKEVPDTEAIRRYLSNGITVPGAHLEPRGKHLRIID